MNTGNLSKGNIVWGMGMNHWGLIRLAWSITGEEGVLFAFFALWISTSKHNSKRSRQIRYDQICTRKYRVVTDETQDVYKGDEQNDEIMDGRSH